MYIKGAQGCENFPLAFFTLSEPIWVCHMGTEPKNGFIIFMFTGVKDTGDKL